MTAERHMMELTADIVAAYVSNNAVAASDLPALVRTVHETLRSPSPPESAAAPEPARRKTASQVQRSITPEGLISFIDGKPYQTLKRHVGKHGMTLSEYKAKFGLPDDYPTTAANYSARRREFAKQIGLGQRDKPQPAPLKGPKQKS